MEMNKNEIIANANIIEEMRRDLRKIINFRK
jgi:hypothetical protein